MAPRGRPARATATKLKRQVELEQLAALERQYSAGHGFALLKAIRLCAASGLPIPGWAAQPIIQRIDRVHSGHEKSLDAVFDGPYPKGRHLKAMRENFRKSFDVFEEVETRLSVAKPPPIDQYLFESVGKKLGINRSDCSKFYYQHKRWRALVNNTLPPTLDAAIEAYAEGRGPFLPRKLKKARQD